VDQYLRTFQWNKVKYRADKAIAELIDSLQKVSPPTPCFHPGSYGLQEVGAIENDVKAKFNQYTQTKTNLAASQRRQT
jgi:V-type H+-transporting ATPase subunit C